MEQKRKLRLYVSTWNTFATPLQSEHEATNEKKALESEIKRCVQRLERSEKLTSGLEEEKVSSSCSR